MKTYFYIKPQNGEVFACEWKEAQLIHDKYKQWGVSDSTTYERIQKELGKESDLLFQDLDRLKKRVPSMRGFLDELELENKKETQEYTEKKEQLDRLWALIEKKTERYKDIKENINRKAFEAEKEAAKGHFEVPPMTRGHIIDSDGRDVTGTARGAEIYRR